MKQCRLQGVILFGDEKFYLMHEIFYSIWIIFLRFKFTIFNCVYFKIKNKSG